MRCPFCNSNLESNARYCNECGTAVDTPSTSSRINYRTYETKTSVPVVRKTPRVPHQTTPYGRPAYTRPVSNAPATQADNNRRQAPAKKNNALSAIIFIVILLIFMIGFLSSVFEGEF